MVIYTLTNISISERHREIATLMVLGYSDREVAQYIYREIFLNSAIGIVFGYSAGAALTFLLYYAIGFGNIADISRFMWLFPPVIIMIFTGLVCLFLYRKIVTVDMNDSLKAVE